MVFLGDSVKVCSLRASPDFVSLLFVGDDLVSLLIKAVNGPLQQRIILLDSDLAAATRPPEDYETDLEEIKEEKESWETRNVFEQRQLSEFDFQRPGIFH